MIFLCLFTFNLIYAQTPKIKFGKLTPSDFQTSIYPIDTSAQAIILADIGSTEFVGNKKGGFSLEFKRFRRARIINQNGYDVANVEIGIYTNGEKEEELLNLKAVTYNLEDGKIVETKLDTKTGIFKDRINRNLVVKKFTFPNIKPGSIIEFEYKLQSDFTFNLQPWEFQSGYPVLWSEYSVSIPEFYNYVTLTQGYQPYFIKDQKDKRAAFTVMPEQDTRNVLASNGQEKVSFSAGVTDFRWVMKDVPALRDEGFTSTIKNYISRIEFQLAEVKEPVFVAKTMTKTWVQTTEELLETAYFGADLHAENEWMGDIIQEAKKGEENSLAQAKNCYYFLRDRMSCTNYNQKYLDNSLKTVWKNKFGNVAEVNLLLTAVLIKAGFQADPVILSTRQNRFAYSLYPLMERINYVITRIVIGDKTYYLDASRPSLGFGQLAYDCYNGHARVVNKEATPIEFKSDSLLEQKFTSVLLVNDSKGGFSGSFQQIAGTMESLDLRTQIKEKGQQYYFTGQKKEYANEIEIKESHIDSLNKFENPVSISYKFDLKAEQEDLIYFNPMLGEGWKENPFKSAQRYYPVEMPYAIDQTYSLQMEIPQGYVVDELPQQLRLKMNSEDEGSLEYRVSTSGNTITLRSRIKIRRTYFSPEEYEMLREFFNHVVKKHNEQIVFKKKK